MSRGVISCPPETGLAAVVATMATPAFRAALILAPEGGRALVITDLDLTRAVVSDDLDRTAADLAREPIATIPRRPPLEQAVALMAKQDLAHLLVAEPGGAWPSGVLSSLDVIAVVGGRDAALTRAIRPGPERHLASARTLSATTVREVMHPRRRLAHTRYADQRARGHDGRLGMISAALVMAGFLYVLLSAGLRPRDAVGTGTPPHHAYLQATTMTFLGIVACQGRDGARRGGPAARRCGPSVC